MSIADRHQSRHGAPVTLHAPRIARHRQRGQAVLWFLATLAACCATLALVYNVGQVTNEKEKTINAADAAAMSGAMVEARMLNFMAYTNRAMIANEVTIAQVISLDSWVQYDNILVQRASDIPIVGEFIEPFAVALQTFVDTGLPELAQAGVRAPDFLVNQVLFHEQGLAMSVAVAAAHDVASQVAQANHTTDEAAGPQLVDDNGFDAAAFGLNQTAWNDFIKENSKDDSGKDDRGNAAQVVVDSLDQFSTYRGLGHAFDLLSDAVITGVDKTSGSTLLRDYDHWEAQDSSDVWVGVSVSIPLIGSFTEKQYTVPVGYGRADANSNGDQGQDWDFGGGPCAQFFVLGCEFAYDSDTPVSGWNGIPTIYDLANPGTASTDPSLTYVVAVKKSPQAGLTTQRIGSGMNNVHLNGPQGSPDLKDNLLGNKDQTAALSAARVSFARPSDRADFTAGRLKRADGAQEYASLYNPYWQARLTDPATVKVEGISAKSALYAALGQAGLNCVSDPTSCP
jgi:hypothetical protein